MPEAEYILRMLSLQKWKYFLKINELRTGEGDLDMNLILTSKALPDFHLRTSNSFAGVLGFEYFIAKYITVEYQRKPGPKALVRIRNMVHRASHGPLSQREKAEQQFEM